MDTLILTAADVQRVVHHVGLDRLMDELIDGLTAAFVAYDPAATDVPVRHGFAYTKPTTGLVEWMPCMDRRAGVTLKVVGYHPANAQRHALPTILSTVSSYDTSSGHLRCLMDGTLLTALRTGAASAVASRALAPPEAAVVGLIGAGAQAVTQLHALTRVFDVRRVVVHDAVAAASASFADRVACFAPDLTVDLAPADTVAAAADILCTATSIELGVGPVFADRDLKPALHINAVGSDFPGKTEVPLSVLQRSFVCPDFRAQALREGESQQLPAEAVGPDLYQLLQAPPQAKVREQLTVFDSTGWALEDHVAMGLVTGYAETLGLGTYLPVEMVSEDARNPYQFAAVPAVVTAS